MFGLIHHQTVTIEPFSAEAATGFGGSATYGTAVSYACRVEMRQAKVVTREGKEAIAIGRVLIHGDVGGEFDVRARLTLPSGYDPSTPPILAIERNPDPFGVCANTVVWFGRTGE